MDQIKKIPEEQQCKNNPWVKCQEKTNCSFCGWNPVVAKQRIESKYTTEIKAD